MKFDWKLQPLQRKLEWDLELARGRLSAASRELRESCGAVRALEANHSAQASAAQAALHRGADPAGHSLALAWLAGAERHLANLRAQTTKDTESVAAARAACRRCQERLEALTTLHDEARRRFVYAANWEATRDADLEWLARPTSEDLT
jgi:hypothetical protein